MTQKNYRILSIRGWLNRGKIPRVKTSEELVMQRQAEEPQGVVPDWAVMLTAGVDVQETSVYYDIVAWGAEWTSQINHTWTVIIIERFGNVYECRV